MTLSDDFDALTVAEVAEALGVPASQLARWCADGTIDAVHFKGNPCRPDRLRFTPESRDELMSQFFPHHEAQCP